MLFEKYEFSAAANIFVFDSVKSLIWAYEKYPPQRFVLCEKEFKNETSKIQTITILFINNLIAHKYRTKRK
jgi:hypothetical protein